MSLLSIVVLTYNQEKMIQQCLDSILLSNTDDVELIVANDCSQDNTKDVIELWLYNNKYKFDSVLFVDNKQNLGTVRNVIQAVNRTNSKYIKTIAGDDWFLPGAINAIKSFCRNNLFDVAFSSMKVAYQDENGNVEVCDEIVPASRINGFFNMDPKEQFRMLTKWCCLPAPGNLFTRSYWDTIELYKADISIAEDWAMWLLGASKSMIFKEIPETLVVYRKHLKSVSRDMSSPRAKKGLSEVAWVLWNIGFSRRDWLSFTDELRLFFLWLIIKTISMLPPTLIGSLDKLRRFLGPIFFKRKFS